MVFTKSSGTKSVQKEYMKGYNLVSSVYTNCEVTEVYKRGHIGSVYRVCPVSSLYIKGECGYLKGHRAKLVKSKRGYTKGGTTKVVERYTVVHERCIERHV